MRAPDHRPTRARLGDWTLLVAGAATLVAIFAIAAFIVWAVVAVGISVGRDTSAPLTFGEYLGVYWPAWAAAAATLIPGLWLGNRHLRRGID